MVIAPRLSLLAVRWAFVFFATLFCSLSSAFGAGAVPGQDAFKSALTANVWTWSPANMKGSVEQLTFEKDGTVRDAGNWNGEWQITGPLEVTLNSSFLSAQAKPNRPYKKAVLHFTADFASYTGTDFFGNDAVAGERKAQSNTKSVAADDEIATLKNGLILYYNFNAKPVEGKVVDASGHSNNGKAVGVEWVAKGHQGGSVAFGISKSYITVPKKAELDPAQFTLAAWIKTSTRDAIWRRIFDKATGVGYDLTMGGDNKGSSVDRGRVVLEAGPAYVRSPVIVGDGNWHQVVGAFDGNFLRIYVDGQLHGRTAQRGKPDGSKFDLTIGANRSNPNAALDEVDASFNGEMDDIMMYNRALSDSEVKALYVQQKTAQDIVLAPPAPRPAPPAASAAKPGPADRLKQLDDLLKQGLITQADYDQKKKEILDSL